MGMKWWQEEKISFAIACAIFCVGIGTCSLVADSRQILIRYADLLGALGKHLLK